MAQGSWQHSRRVWGWRRRWRRRRWRSGQRWRRWRGRWRQRWRLTSAHGTRILSMRIGWCNAPSAEPTLLKPRLRARASNIVHPDCAGTSAKACAARCIGCRRVAQLPAHDMCIVNAPLVIRHGAPFAIVIDLDTALARPTAPNKPHEPFHPGRRWRSRWRWWKRRCTRRCRRGSRGLWRW